MALDLYQKAALRFPSHYGALLNLGILYEDRLQFDRARACYSRILDVYPNDGRARLYYKVYHKNGLWLRDIILKRYLVYSFVQIIHIC